MNNLKRIFKIWLPFVVTISAFCLLVYAAVQQSYRQGANDPQIQMAQDAADLLGSGSTADSIVPQQKIDIAKSLASFYVLYDRDGKPIAGNGILNGQLPEIPKGVLDVAKQNGENRRTWEPESNVRIASVVVPYKDGFVLAGRNLREVEIRESQLTTFVEITWVLTLAATLLLIAVGEYLLSEKKQ